MATTDPIAQRSSHPGMDLRLLRAAAAGDRLALEAALDDGAFIDAAFRLENKVHAAALPHALRGSFRSGTALCICCAMACEPFASASENAKGLACAKALIERGACPDGLGAGTTTPLATAIRLASGAKPIRAKPAAAKAVHMAQELVKAGARVDLPDYLAATALMHALDAKSGVLSRCLVDLGASIHGIDEDGTSLAWRHAHDSDVHALSLILDLGGDPNGADFEGRTPLWAAANTRSHPTLGAICVQILANRGARVDGPAIRAIQESPAAEELSGFVAAAEAKLMASAAREPGWQANAPRL